jgi:hypothetical protein
MASVRLWWRNLGPWSSEHAALWGVVTGVLTGLIWFGASYAIDPHAADKYLLPVVFGAVMGVVYYMRARINRSP